MIIKCAGCNEEYDAEMFPVCPFCMTPNESAEVQDADSKVASEVLTDNSKKSDEDTEAVQDETNMPDPDSFTAETNDRNNLPQRDQEKDNSVGEPENYVLESEKTGTDAPLDIRIDSIKDLSNRAKNLLSRNSIFTMSELILFVKESDLSNLRNAGAKTVKEITDLIDKYYANMVETLPVNTDKRSICNVFWENKFNIFVRYCDANNIVTLDDLSSFDFELLRNVQGIGTGKLKEIISRYQAACSIDFGSEERSFDSLAEMLENQERLFENINEQLQDLSIDFLSGLKITKKQIEALKTNKITSIRDLKGISVKRLGAIVRQSNIDKYKKISPMLEYNLIELFGKVLSDSSGDNNYAITLLRAEGYSLQDIADTVGVSRQRILQIITKYIQTLDPFMVPIIDRLMEPKGYATIQELLDIYDNDEFDKIVIYWCKNRGKIHYLNYADILLPITIDIQSIEADFAAIAEEFVGNGISLSEHADDLVSMLQEKNYHYMDVDAFLGYMQYHGYVLYGDYIVKGRKRYSALCERMVAEQFPNGIKIYDTHDLNTLREYALKVYGDIGIPDEDRPLTSRLADVLVLRGRGIYTAEENVHVEGQLIEELKSFIDEQPEAEIYYANIFASNEGMIRMMSDIDNYNYLHGVLKLYFGQEYDFSNRDYLKKNGEGLSSGKLSDRLKKYVLQAGKPVHRKDINKEFAGLTDIVLFNAVLYDESLFQWNYNCISSLEIIDLTDQEKDYLKNTILEIMDDTSGYCNDNMLFSKVRRSRPEILEKNNMTDARNLFYLCAKIFSDAFEFRCPHICRQGLLSSMSVKTVALYMLDNPTNLLYSDYQRTAGKLQWSHGTTSGVFADIEQDYFRINDDLYIKKDAVRFNENDLTEIESWLKEKLKNGFVSLITTDFDGLPGLQYEWNSFLLRSVVENYCSSFKIIETSTKDRRYERGIVLEADSPINDYIDLVIWVMEKNGYSMLPENKMLSLLVVNGLTYKMIPRDLYVSNKLIVKNEMFIINTK